MATLKRQRDVDDVGDVDDVDGATPPPAKRVRLSTDAEKRCSKCQTLKPTDQFSRHACAKDGLQTYCKSCNAEIDKIRCNSTKGFIQRLVASARCSSKHREVRGRDHGVPTITAAYLTELMVENKGCCALTGVTLSFKQHSKWQASLDRIDDDQGYHPGNVRMVALEVNTAKEWTREKIRIAFREDPMLLPVLTEVSFDAPKRMWTPRNTTPDAEGLILCWRCETRLPLDKFYTKLSQGCKPCACARVSAIWNTPRGRLQRLVGDFKSSHKTRVKQSARAKDDRGDAGECTLTFDEIVAIYRKQGGRCYYSRLPLGFSSDDDWLISLERLDVTKTYTAGNVVLVCCEFNAIDCGIQSGTDVQGWSVEKVEEVREVQETQEVHEVLKTQQQIHSPSCGTCG
jgi:hypothetical protein